MFNQAIDAIQTGKKKIVTTFVKDDTLKAHLVELVDTQTKFYQGWLDTTCSIVQDLTKVVRTANTKGAK